MRSRDLSRPHFFIISGVIDLDHNGPPMALSRLHTVLKE